VPNIKWSGDIENQKLGWEATRTHGMAATPTYRSWASMLQRCTNPNNKRWARYGGRGITVCERWRKFDNFLADMGVRPEGLTIERINNDGNYEPGNCEWIPRGEQQANTRRNRLLTFNGETDYLFSWAKRLGIEPGTISTRLYSYGWTVERALSKDPEDRKKKTNKSGYPNIFPVKSRWSAQIRIGYKKYVNLGIRDTIEEARQLQLDGAKKYGVDIK
jgi:hypothetical protein